MGKEIDMREKIELRGLTMNTVKAQSSLLTVVKYPNQKGRVQDFQDTKNKQA